MFERNQYQHHYLDETKKNNCLPLISNKPEAKSSLPKYLNLNSKNPNKNPKLNRLTLNKHNDLLKEMDKLENISSVINKDSSKDIQDKFNRNKSNFINY